MSTQRDSWVKNYDDVDFDVAFLGYPSSSQLQEQEQERMLDLTLLDSTPSTSTSSPEPQHPLIAGASPSVAPPADVLPRQSSHGRPVFTLSDPPAATQSAPSSFHGRPTYTLSDSVSPPLASDTPNTNAITTRSPRSSSFKSFASSPLNPTSPAFQSPFARPGSRASAHINRIPSEDCRALSIGGSPLSMSTVGSRGSMILYKLPVAEDGALMPPSFPRSSVYSTSGDSIVSLSSDSKYPAGSMMSERGLVAYAYDPSTDDDTEEDMDELKEWKEGGTISWRGIINVTALVALIAALLCLFIVYPVYRAFNDTGINEMITRNTRINATGQADLDTRGLWEVDCE